MNNGSPTRNDVFLNTDSAIDLTICSSSVRLDYNWSVDEDNHDSNHFPVHLKPVRNISSSCRPKWKTSEADWKLFNKSTKVESDIRTFDNPVTAYNYLISIILCGAMLSIPKTSGKPR